MPNRLRVWRTQTHNSPLPWPAGKSVLHRCHLCSSKVIPPFLPLTSPCVFANKFNPLSICPESEYRSPAEHVHALIGCPRKEANRQPRASCFLLCPVHKDKAPLGIVDWKVKSYKKELCQVIDHRFRTWTKFKWKWIIIKTGPFEVNAKDILTFVTSVNKWFKISTLKHSYMLSQKKQAGFVPCHEEGSPRVHVACGISTICNKCFPSSWIVWHSVAVVWTEKAGECPCRPLHASESKQGEPKNSGDYG